MSPEEIKQALASDPGDPVFAGYAEGLRAQGNPREALDVCLRGLSANPACYKGRLVLAHVFFDLNYLPFAVREVEELCRALPQISSLQRLREKLAPEPGQSGGAEETVAEADFEFDELEMIEDDEEGQ